MDGEDARKVKNHCFIYQMPGRLLQLLLTERERMKNEEKDIERLIWGLQIKKTRWHFEVVRQDSFLTLKQYL